MCVCACACACVCLYSEEERVTGNYLDKLEFPCPLKARVDLLVVLKSILKCTHTHKYRYMICGHLMGIHPF